MNNIKAIKGISDTEYVKHRGLICPNCKGHGVTTGGPESNDGFLACIFVSCSCHDCGAEWTDEYELTGYDNLFISKEK